ncbi:MAG: PINc/VapC family ATPase [Candidatus Woesearchaeota archaeon]|nr:PINc/VapC family ATPase [Candidatus Woesearchaeota archaeon]
MKKEKSEAKISQNNSNPQENKFIEKIVPDFSAIVEGALSRKIEGGEILPNKILLHEAAVAELEHMASEEKSLGFMGLDELMRIRELSKSKGFSIEFLGRKPSPGELERASVADIDSMIMELCYNEDSALITSNKIQARVAKARGVNLILVEPKSLFPSKIQLKSFFDPETMSVHLRENVFPVAKKGMPGNWKFVVLSDKQLTREKIQEISTEIIEQAGFSRAGFIEIDRPGSTIVQLGEYRIVITRPPFSDGWEITAVKPIKKLSLSEYQMSDNLRQRISEHAEGILIAGSPGMGKSTFAQALAEFYSSKQKIVKTIEAPRDLVLPEEITQYSMSNGTPQEIHDILLLSRPDYTIFDEMRNTDDFRLFADLRLSGIGLAGVVHATNPIDAIQRFVGRIELGVIPQIIDTVIFIKNGAVEKVLSLRMVVKVPSGMTEADLARPIVVVADFETKKVEYELYSYGEETVVVPVTPEMSEMSPARNLAGQKIEEFFQGYSDKVKVSFESEHKAVVHVPEGLIGKIIGKEGENIRKIEEKLGIGLDIKPIEENSNEEKIEEGKTPSNSIRFNAKIVKKGAVFAVPPEYSRKEVRILINGEFIMSANVGKEGIVKISGKHKIGRIIIDAINAGDKVSITR